MRIESVESNRQNMHLPRKFFPLLRCILQRPPFFARKNGRIGTASDSLYMYSKYHQNLSKVIKVIECTSVHSNIHSRKITQMSSKGEQQFLNVTYNLDLIYI